MTTPSDHQVRQQALDVKHSFIVKAPAGSGKTTLLVKRYLNLLATVNNPEEIIAITFTRKAASEMIERVLSALGSVATSSTNKTIDEQLTQLASKALRRDQRQQWQLLRNPGRIRIQTIDAYSNRLVRQMPWSAGFGAAPSVVTDDVVSLYQRAARQTVTNALSTQKTKPIMQRLLLSVDNDFSRLCSLIVSMLMHRDQWQTLAVGTLADSSARQQLEQNWAKTVKHILRACDDKLPDNIRSDLWACARYSAQTLSSQGSSSPICVLADIENFPQVKVEHIQYWQALARLLLTSSGTIRKKVDVNAGFPTKANGGDEALKTTFKAVLESLDGSGIENELPTLLTLPDSAYSDEEWQLLMSLVEILKLAIAQLKLIFQDHGICDHIEIATRANLSLGDVDRPTDLSLRLDYQIKHILVDEFQDTSHTQMELFRLLTAGWQSGDGKTAFFVGDPMQSIYRFRQADVGIFINTFNNGLENVQLQPLELSENFRSSAVVVDWVNDTFSTVFPCHDDKQTCAVKYSPSKAFNGKSSEHDQVSVHLTDRYSEAGSVCQLIKHLNHSGSAKQQIAVLVRSRTHLNEIVKALQKENLPYQGIKLQRLSAQSCIQDILALTLALTHFADRLSWLAILRAPWCGLDLAALTHIASRADEKTIWQVIQDPPTPLCADSVRRLNRLVSIIKPLVDKVGREPVHFLVANAWQALGGADVTTCAEHASIKTFIELLAQQQWAGEISDVNELKRNVDELWATSLSGESNLQLMTIHMAKGLEFDTVILPGLFKKPAIDEVKLLIWNQFSASDSSASLLVSPIKVRNKDSRRYDFIRTLDKNIQSEESKRLFYVACTRAKSQLHLFVSADADAQSLQRTIKALHPTQLDTSARTPIQESSEPIQSIIYHRLPLDYSPPKRRQRLTQIQHSLPSDSIIEYQWAGVSAVHIGTLIHEVIYKIAERNLKPGEQDIKLWKSRLASLGVDDEQLEKAIQLIKLAVKNIYGDDRAKWVLRPSHQQVKNEWAISRVNAGALENIIIDRTFIDEDGIRWIIDYKTSTHEGGNIEGFLDNEQNRYCSQLENYASIIRSGESNPIRLGLYFPLLKAWREWEYGG